MEFSDYIRFVAALIFVLGLIGGTAWIFRHFKLAERWASFAPAARRLQVIESLPLDPRRRLMIIRRDDTEHLIVLGANNETVVETDIVPPADLSNEPVSLELMRDDRHNEDPVLPRVQGGGA